MADMKDHYFRQRVQENDMDDAFGALEQADQDLALDGGLGQVASSAGVSELNTPPPAANLGAFLGGIHSGLRCSFSPAPSGGAPTVNLKINVSAGWGHDCRGRRVVVGYKHDATSGRLTLVNASYIVDCAAEGSTPVGEGGSVVGGAAVQPPVGQTRWITLGIIYDRLLLDPKVDGHAQTVFFSRNESFRFVVKMGAASAGTPTPPPPDPDVVILGDFQVNNTNQIVAQDFKRRGDWIRTTIGATGDPTLVTTETEANTTNFVQGNPRHAILRILRQLGTATGTLTSHVDQAAPTDRHHAKNIDVDKSSATFADGSTLPWIVPGPVPTTKLGGGTNADGLQFVLNNLVQILGSTGGAIGSGTARLGVAALSDTTPTGVLSTSPSTLLQALNTIVAAVNSRGILHLPNDWMDQNYFHFNTSFFSEAFFQEETFFSERVQFDSTSIIDGTEQVTHIGEQFTDVAEKIKLQAYYSDTSELAAMYLENGATGSEPGISLVRNCHWNNGTQRWLALNTSKPATRIVLTSLGLQQYHRVSTIGTWSDTEGTGGWTRKFGVRTDTSAGYKEMMVSPDNSDGAIHQTNVSQSMAIGWEGFHPTGATGTIGGMLHYRFGYNVFAPSSITVGGNYAGLGQDNATGTVTFVSVQNVNAYWTLTPNLPNAHTRVARFVIINP